MVQVPVRQCHEHAGSGRAGKRSESLDEQPTGFGTGVYDDEGRTGVLDNIDVFPYGTYTQTMDHARA